jgi:hypothetical protein
MKINRFAMSQKTFTAMVKTWATQELANAGRLLVFAQREGGAANFCACEKQLKEIRDVVSRTFLEPDNDVREFLKCIDSMEHRITLERAVPA